MFDTQANAAKRPFRTDLSEDNPEAPDASIEPAVVAATGLLIVACLLAAQHADSAANWLADGIPALLALVGRADQESAAFHGLVVIATLLGIPAFGMAIHGIVSKKAQEHDP